jgi:hypothetical protein
MALLIVLACAFAQAAAPDERVYSETLRPYRDALPAQAVDASTLRGKVMCGYQGWFRCEGDGSGLKWHHYGHGGRFEPGACGIELWPDVTELTADERFPTAFQHADGSTAHVFSSVHPKTVRRHFDWMQQHGIDGVFVQRFATTVRSPAFTRSINQVLVHCHNSANATGRAWALMYDLTGIRPQDFGLLKEDWQLISKNLWPDRPRRDKAYLHHGGKPVIALWGLGFNDRSPMLEQWADLIDYFQNDPQYGGCTVMVGVPTYWRTQSRDTITDANLHDVIAKAQIVSPWMVGRFGSPEAAGRHYREVVPADRAWCVERRIDYLPVAFPGFSWHNLMAGRGKEAKLDQIPRLGGRFFWSQCAAAVRAECDMLYVAMFDEMDEATAIFKCTNDPPVGKSPFLTYEDMPSDHYLWLTGQAGRMVRGEIKPTDAPPQR